MIMKRNSFNCACNSKLLLPSTISYPLSSAAIAASTASIRRFGRIVIAFLLAILASSSLLLAQAQNRLEVRGDRLEETENQSTGYRLEDRLEMPLQRQEMEDRRWKMEDKTQGCSFQKIEGNGMNGEERNDLYNSISLLKSGSIPISHLPSSISYLGVAPKLMMDPKILQERVVALKERLECFRKKAPLLDSTTIGITRETVSAAGCESNSSISQLPSTVIAATSSTSHLLPVTSPRPVSRRFNSCAWGIFLHNALEGASKTLADLHIDVVAARYKGKHISEAWAKIIPTAERVVQYIRNCLADYYSYNIYPQGLAAIDRAEEALKLRIKEAKNMEKWNSKTYSITADAMENAAKYMVNSLLAEKAANKFLAENWIQISQLSIAKSRDSSLHIGVVTKKEKSSEGSSNRGNSFRYGNSSSQRDKLSPLEKGIQNAKDFLASAVTYSMHAEEAKMLDLADPKYSVNQSVECAKESTNHQTSSNCARSSEPQLPSSISHLPSPTAAAVSTAYHLLPPTTILPAEQIVAADLWKQAAEQSRIACMNQVKANLFYSSQNETQARCLEKTVASGIQERDQLAVIAEYATNALQAEVAGNQELFDFWTLGAKQLQFAWENGLQLVAYKTAKNGKKDSDLNNEDISLRRHYLANESANHLDTKKNVDGYIARAAKAQAVGNQNLADLWMHAARQVQMLYEMNVQPTRSHIDKIYDAHFGKEDESDEERSFVANPFHQYGGAVGDFIESVKQAANEWDNVSEYTAKATEIRTSGDQEVAELWSQAAMHMQTAAENSVQVAFAHINNNWNEIYRLMNVAKSARKTANHFVKLADYTVKATAAEVNPTFAIGDGDLSQYTRPQNSFQKPSCTKGTPRLLENNFETKSLRNIIHPNCESRVKGNQEIADIWRFVIRHTQMAEKNRITANQAWIAGNVDDAKRIEETFYSARNIINDLIKSVEVITNRLALADYALLKAEKATENKEIADCWRQIAKHYKNAAKHGSSIAHCYKNEDVDNNLLKNKIRELEEASRREESAAERIFGFIYNLEEVEGYKNKALTAKLQGNQELEKAWNNLAEQTQVITDLYNRAAQARDINNNWQECQKISKQAEIEETEIPILLDIADYLAQAVNAKLAGNQDAANMWVQGAGELEKSRQYPSNMDNIKHLFKDTHISRSTHNGLRFPRLVLERNCSAIRKSTKSRGSILALAAGYAMKAQENMTSGNQKLAYWWTQVVQQSQQTVHYEDQSAQAFINGNEDEANFLGQAAIASWNAAKTIVKIAENYENHQDDFLNLNQPKIVATDLLEERVKQFQIAAERFSKAALCRSVDNYIASDLWAQAAKQVEIANETTQRFFHQLHDNFLDNDNRASDFARSIGDELAKVAAMFDGFNLETGIETGDLSQYTLSQNIFSEPLRTVKVCSGSVKTILEQNPYEISSSSIFVSRFKVESRNEMNSSVQDVVGLFVKAAEYNANARTARSSIPTRVSIPTPNKEEDSSSEEEGDWAHARTARSSIPTRVSIPTQNKEEDSSSEEEGDVSNLMWSKKLVTVKTPSQQTIQLNHTTGEQSDHFIQSAPPQEVGSERLQKLASLWDKAAQQSQVAAKSKAKEIMATMGQNNYNAYLIVTTETLQDSANKFAQAAEAFAAGNEAASDVLVQAAERQSELADKQKSKGSNSAVNCRMDHDF